MSKIVFRTVPSTSAFFESDNFTNFIVGPIGSTKTTASIMKIAYEARKMAPCKDGIRRSRCAVIRNTAPQLSDTTIPDFLKWFPEGVAGNYIRSEKKFILKFADIECEVLFRGLDDANDVRRLLSLQLSFAMLDEVREISPEIFNALTGRVGRYPDSMLVPHKPEWGLDEKGHPRAGCVDDNGRPMKKIWGATNPPDMDTFWHGYLSNPGEKTHVTVQPSGLSPDADWIHLLPSGYYEDLIVGKSQDWIDVYVHGLWGKSLAGTAVFTSFKRDYHVAKNPLIPLRATDRPLIVGMDFGLNPSATISQVDMRGRLLTFAALTSDGMGLLRFIRTVLKPTLAARFLGLPVLVIGDPAGIQRSQTDEKSCFDILKSEGFRVIAARSNSPVARVAAVDAFLMRQVDGGAGHLIDPSCKPLIAALSGGYRYKRKKNGEIEDTPEKNQFSHIADAHQYGCLHADGNVRGGQVGSVRREIKPARTMSAWT